MSILTTVVIALICTIIGFFIGKFWTLRTGAQHELEAQVEKTQTELSQYKQDVASHFETTNQLMAQLKSNYDQVNNHIEETSKLLQKPEVQADLFPFFSKETSEQMQASLEQLQENKRSKVKPDSQPKDYSKGASGLLNAENSSNKEQTVES